MRTVYTNSSRCKRMIIVAQINNLRRFEHKDLIDSKIYREMRKLHSLWFRDYKAADNADC